MSLCDDALNLMSSL